MLRDRPATLSQHAASAHAAALYTHTFAYCLDKHGEGRMLAWFRGVMPTRGMDTPRTTNQGRRVISELSRHSKSNSCRLQQAQNPAATALQRHECRSNVSSSLVQAPICLLSAHKPCISLHCNLSPLWPLLTSTFSPRTFVSFSAPCLDISVPRAIRKMSSLLTASCWAFRAAISASLGPS